MTIRLTSAAQADVEVILEWYGERGQQLREHFHQALKLSLEFVQANPYSCARIHDDIRRALLRRFPFCVFYVLESDEIVVLACMHGHRDPALWRSRRDE